MARPADIDATRPDGYDQPLFRLRWTNNRDRWAFAIWLAQHRRLRGIGAAQRVLRRHRRGGHGLRLRPLPQRHQRLGITRSTFRAPALVSRNLVPPRISW
jgi:hypothetical protein